jgi:hypothetical protein
VSEDRSFHGSATPGGRSDRHATTVLLVLLIAFIGFAIAKPWGSQGEPAPSARLPRASVTPPPPSIQTTAPEVPSTRPAASTRPGANARALPVAFSTSLPPVSAMWTGLDWRRLAPGDPLSLVTSILPWRRGFIAVGWVAGPPSTPVWTSADGTHWDVLPFNTSSTFWPGHVVLGVARVGTGLVALTETVEYCPEPCPPTFELPVVAWTSTNGRKWTPRLLPPEWLAEPSGGRPLFAGGPGGLVVASSGSAARLATSTDGSHWQLLPADTFPSGFALTDLRATAAGYAAVGRVPAADGRDEAVALESRDGRQWSEIPAVLATGAEAAPAVGSAGPALVIALDGMVAVERDGTTPGPARWWQSADGRDWRPLTLFPPLGPTTCVGEGCGPQPNGALVGDGERMVAARGGADAAAWTSSDGLTWRRLRVTGDLPDEQATQAVLLPGGVLFTDGTTTWYGEAQTR